MDIETRLAKVEVEVGTNKEAIEKLTRAIDDLRASVERGFSEQRTAMERGFAEQRAALTELRLDTDHKIAELRRETNLNFRWLYGLNITNLTFTIGIIARMAGIV